MPTYEYTCKYCNGDFEIFHSITQPPLTKCPECRRKGLERRIGRGAGVIFKGSGFYETDYKRRREDAPKDSRDTPKEKSKECS